MTFKLPLLIIVVIYVGYINKSYYSVIFLSRNRTKELNYRIKIIYITFYIKKIGLSNFIY